MQRRLGRHSTFPEAAKPFWLSLKSIPSKLGVAKHFRHSSAPTKAVHVQRRDSVQRNRKSCQVVDTACAKSRPQKIFQACVACLCVTAGLALFGDFALHDIPPLLRGRQRMALIAIAISKAEHETGFSFCRLQQVQKPRVGLLSAFLGDPRSAWKWHDSHGDPLPRKNTDEDAFRLGWALADCPPANPTPEPPAAAVLVTSPSNGLRYHGVFSVQWCRRDRGGFAAGGERLHVLLILLDERVSPEPPKSTGQGLTRHWAHEVVGSRVPPHHCQLLLILRMRRGSWNGRQMAEFFAVETWPQDGIIGPESHVSADYNLFGVDLGQTGNIVGVGSDKIRGVSRVSHYNIYAFNDGRGLLDFPGIYLVLEYALYSPILDVPGSISLLVSGFSSKSIRRAVIFHRLSGWEREEWLTGSHWHKANGETLAQSQWTFTGAKPIRLGLGWDGRVNVRMMAHHKLLIRQLLSKDHELRARGLCQLRVGAPLAANFALVSMRDRVLTKAYLG
ncbi:hypothetical protein C8F04DRAFT_1177289 [Mycena alexandri]|uniref:Uncharacterized protein n=1 Tax=Mycena alexandri TaxID=1745969 RepID=A0AAD6XDN8_9AGAR|nr:hypothetical protein C8F04DRAFT_1177289 [Mycena alexandri]